MKVNKFKTGAKAPQGFMELYSSVPKNERREILLSFILLLMVFILGYLVVTIVDQPE